jgi:hypothetical protein
MTQAQAEHRWGMGLHRDDMIYNARNSSAGSTVVDIDSRTQLTHVLMINTKTGAVVVAKQPVRVNHKGQIDRETITFRSIYPIQVNEPYPVMFHCYGRQ